MPTSSLNTNSDTDTNSGIALHLYTLGLTYHAIQISICDVLHESMQFKLHFILTLVSLSGSVRRNSMANSKASALSANHRIKDRDYLGWMDFGRRSAEEYDYSSWGAMPHSSLSQIKNIFITIHPLLIMMLMYLMYMFVNWRCNIHLCQIFSERFFFVVCFCGLVCDWGRESWSGWHSAVDVFPINRVRIRLWPQTMQALSFKIIAHDTTLPTSPSVNGGRWNIQKGLCNRTWGKC